MELMLLEIGVLGVCLNVVFEVDVVKGVCFYYIVSKCVDDVKVGIGYIFVCVGEDVLFKLFSFVING